MASSGQESHLEARVAVQAARAMVVGRAMVAGPLVTSAGLVRVAGLADLAGLLGKAAGQVCQARAAVPACQARAVPAHCEGRPGLGACAVVVACPVTTGPAARLAGLAMAEAGQRDPAA